MSSLLYRRNTGFLSVIKRVDNEKRYVFDRVLYIFILPLNGRFLFVCGCVNVDSVSLVFIFSVEPIFYTVVYPGPFD